MTRDGHSGYLSAVPVPVPVSEDVVKREDTPSRDLRIYEGIGVAFKPAEKRCGVHQRNQAVHSCVLPRRNAVSGKHTFGG